MAEGILIAIAVKFGVLPLAAWIASLLALRGRPSGGKTVVGVGCCLLAAVGTAYLVHVFSLSEANVIIAGATLLLVVGHIVRYVSWRRQQRSPGSPSVSLSDRRRRLWRYL